MCPRATNGAVLDVDVHHDGVQNVVRLKGELDLATASSLEAKIAELDARPCVVELGGLDFLDCAGLRALEHLSEALTAQGERLVVTRSKPPVAKVLKLVWPGDWD